MKKFIVLGAALALMVGGVASAATFDYGITGWQVTCSNSWSSAIEGDCLYNDKSQGALSTGVIAGTAQFDDVAGTLTTNTTIDVDGGVAGLATMTITGQYFVLQNYGHPQGSNVVAGSGGTQTCADSSPSGDPGTGVICTTGNTPSPLYYIDMGTPGVSTVNYMIDALSGANRAWQSYTLTVPEPGTALLLGAGLLGLALAGRRS